MADKLRRSKASANRIAHGAIRNYDARNNLPSCPGSSASRQKPARARLESRGPASVLRRSEVSMRIELRVVVTGFLVVLSAAGVSAQQIGKYVPINAGSEADHAMTEISAASDPAQKL